MEVRGDVNPFNLIRITVREGEGVHREVESKNAVYKMLT
jgi:hypothetical protein